MIQAGAAVIDITPPPGLAMSGFAARCGPAEGVHDRLTARALAIGDTAIVVADVIGIDAAMAARIRKRSVLLADSIVVAALHNHGGPPSMAGRLSIAADPAFLERLEDACVAALDKAAASRKPARLEIAEGVDPDVGRNRRHVGGPVDRALPLLRARGAEDGRTIAFLISYACHPVVLGADNLQWTADYPHFVRHALEEAEPGAVALFLTGCVGDVNTGHSAAASVSLARDEARTYAAAARIGRKIAACALQAPARPVNGPVAAVSGVVTLDFQRRETVPVADLAQAWSKERETAEPARRSLLGYWIEWAQTVARSAPEPLSARVTVFDWGGVLLIALPGEIFAETALFLRTLPGVGAGAFLVGFAEDNPGYIPPESEYVHGGYEVDEAHRYYGQSMSFAPGSAEALAQCAAALVGGAAENSRSG
ncbi:neutral/alkaline non-lysosomal ceramidase N-terminal domain-containing protein [Martelella mediterranea]|uniref:Neutral/alkaline non-lysosomal ceramidase n=1 Tax=Martelella mediterranea DSM 17316 TaxID=1122214 RepID=A0A1U9ZAA5_9HYPH|nr:neutral/alkaline non-lysosomal ceramidase N-terminal domain-containing protein [Martelella mediterranea]AQZ54520.1 Neutral/alkaline non-lysosomal ceramidase [Martelella mediterranea DSM 17316]